MQAITAARILEKAVELGDLSGTGLMAAMTALDKVSYLGLNGDMTYGPVADRMQPDTSSIFAYDRPLPAASPPSRRAMSRPEDAVPASDAESPRGMPRPLRRAGHRPFRRPLADHSTRR